MQIEFRGLGLQPSDDLGVKVKPHTLLLGCHFPNIGLRGAGVLSQGRIHFGAADDPGSPRSLGEKSLSFACCHEMAL